MSVVLPWESEQRRNYMCMVQVVDEVIAKELRKIFKREWNSRYQKNFGAWHDTSKSGEQLFNQEKNRPNADRNILAKLREGDTSQWDCSALFYAILSSSSIGASSLDPGIRGELENLRTLRNDIKHPGRETLMLSESNFQTMITNVENAFKALGIPTNDITQMKEKRNQYKSFQVLPLKPTHDVVNRPEKINEIKQELEILRNNNGGKLTYYYISGNPGCGKSQLARQICENLLKTVNWRTETAFVMTMNAKDTDSLLDSYQDFCRRLNCCDSILVNIMYSYESKKRKIEQLRSLITTRIKTWKKWWIIVDNVEDLDMIYPFLPMMGDKDWNNGQIIITIQNTTSVPCDSSLTKQISLSDGMKSYVSRELLSLLSGTVVDDPVLDEVAKMLDHQPLAMAAAAVYVKKRIGFSWQDYMKKLEEGKRHIIDEKWNSTYSSSMFAAVRLAVMKCADNNAILEHAFYLFSMISFHPLPREVIYQFIQQLNQDCHKEEIYLEIKNCSLFLIKSEDHYVHLHRVAHDVIKILYACENAEIDDNPHDQLGIFSKKSKIANDSKVYHVFKALYFFEGRFDEIKLIPHKKALIASVEKKFTENNSLYSVFSALEKHEISKICKFFGQKLRYYDELDLAKHYFEQALKFQENQLDPNHLDIAESYTNLGTLYCENYELDQAIDFYQQALEVQEQKLGANHVNVAKTYTRLGIVYR